MDLHYSQTEPCYPTTIYLFESPMDLHYSQTKLMKAPLHICLNPLWIYTTLKLSR